MSEALVDRLRGIYRIPITDGLGAVGSGEEPDNPNEFVRKFETAPIQHEAADRIEALEREVKELRADIETFWKPQFDEQVERAEAAEAERDEARISLGEAEHHLSNLLARIHRDGGHYEADHGAVKAAEDANKIVANLYAAEADKARLSETVAGLCDWIENEVGAELPFAARAALSGSVSGWRAMDSAPETGFFLAWSPDFPDMVSCWKAELFHQARKPGTPRHLSANHFTLWRPLDLPAAPQQGGE
jgi:hypothetical protein